jgi:pseudaminic acid synthase
MNLLKIDTFNITPTSPVFIIAELSANHNGSIENALETIKAAKRAGADCIKLQTYTADTITLDSDKDDFKIKGTIWEGKNLHKLYQEAYTPWEWHKTLFDAAKAEGLVCFSSPFDKTSVDLLEELNAPAYKIASFEITDIPLIEYVASKGKPVIISTGIAEQEDIELALDACKRMGNDQIALLKKHFILDRSIGGPDASFSMNEQEFTAMVKAVREAEAAVGVVDYTLTEKQRKGRDFCRSLYITEDVKEGDVFNEKNVRSIRPGFGLHPKHYNDIIGKTSKRNLEKGTRFDLDFIA